MRIGCSFCGLAEVDERIESVRNGACACRTTDVESMIRQARMGGINYSQLTMTCAKPPDTGPNEVAR